MSVKQPAFPVAVIGGGPVGLAAAAHLVTRGVPVKLYEAGESVAANVRDWGHVRLFSPWRFNTDMAAAAILRERGWQDTAGRHVADRARVVFGLPLAAFPGARIRRLDRDRRARAATSRATASTRL